VPEEDKKVRPEVLQAVLLEEVAERLMSIELMLKKQVPTGIVEPLNPFMATSTARVVKPPHHDKLWFSVTIVKEGDVELHLRINTKYDVVNSYTMGADEKVYDQDFSIPCIEDIQLWTNVGETCWVKIRGSR